MLLLSQDEISKRTKLSLVDTESITQTLSHQILPVPERVSSSQPVGLERFTTGDEALDELLGGGLRTGVVWELSGEG